jgi:tetratricopeptide (TPR) repeat protein
MGAAEVDVHAPYVRELVEAGDWAGLVRYWMAHQHPLALEAALALARREAVRPGGHWAVLADFLADVARDLLSPERDLPEELAQGWPRPEQATLFLLFLYPRVALCEMAAEAPVEMQEALLRVGLEAGEQACGLVGTPRDAAVAAFFRSVLARGHLELRQLEAARDSYTEALRVYCGLAEQRPDVYRLYVAMTLTNLGKVQRDLKEWEAARASYTEALGVYRGLAEQRPGVYGPDVAATLNNLGNVQRDLNELEAARSNFTQALGIRRALAEQRPEVSGPDVATSLNNLGTVQCALHDLEAARSSFTEALGVFRRLAEQRPEIYGPLVAGTLNNLGKVQRDLNATWRRPGKAAPRRWTSAACWRRSVPAFTGPTWP